MVPQKMGLVGESCSTFYDRRAAGSAFAAGRVARLAARVRSGSLNRALIAGTDPAGSPRLAARAAWLTSPRARASIADALESLLAAAQGPPRRRRMVPRRDPLLAHAAELRELAALLRADRLLYARGIAILDQLVSDGTGPAYFGGDDDLERQLHDARAALNG
jgi:hypothetical protein